MVATQHTQGSHFSKKNTQTHDTLDRAQKMQYSNCGCFVGSVMSALKASRGCAQIYLIKEVITFI